MGGPKRPTGDELLRRMQAWGDDWRAVAGSTEPADRPRAEAAIRRLYAAADMREPVIRWVPSPAGGILAYAFASLSHAKVINPLVRGEIGTGRSRDFLGLAEPFGTDPAWRRRVMARTVERLPAGRRTAPEVPSRQGGWGGLGSRIHIDPFTDVTNALGLAGTLRVATAVRAVAGNAALAPDLPAAAARPDDVDAAARVLGPAWDRLALIIGIDLARGVIGDALGRLVHDVLTEPRGHRDAIQAMQPGQWDAETPVLAAARDVFGGYLWRQRAGRAGLEARIDARLDLASSAGPWWALDGVAIVSERPLVLRRDDRDRPHASDGPALAWGDGLETYAWHGVQVEPWVIRDPDRITVELIDSEVNVEVRRVLVERFGEERLIREGGSALVHEDDAGRLWRRELKAPGWGQRQDEAVCMVEVVNSTPEPDGTRKTYFLRVPPAMRTAHEAVAWTFGLGTVEYQPAIET